MGGTGEIPEPAMSAIERTPKTEAFGDADQLSAGMVHYQRNCAVCHGELALSSGVLPDLRWSAVSANADAWNGIVLGGSLASRGMVSFAEHLDPAGAEAIRAYVVKQAHIAADR